MIITPTVHLPTVAPGPNVELLVQGINANLVPSPNVSDAPTWTTLVAGASVAGVWSRSTAAFASTPASLRMLVTGTTSSGFIPLTPWQIASEGQQVTVSAKASVAVTDGVRLPRVRIVARNQAGTELTVNAISWPTTVNATFTTQSAVFSLPAGTVEFRAVAAVEGIATASMTVYFDDFEVVLQKGATTITVNKIWGSESSPIQGAVNTPILGTDMLFIDYAIPANTQVIYQVVTDLNGIVKVSELSTPVVAAFQGLWLSDPLIPSVAILTNPGLKSSRSKTFSKDGVLLQGVGRTKPVSINGVRRVASKIPVEFYTYTSLQTFAMESLISNTDPLMVRCSDEFNLPALCYISAVDVLAEYVDAPLGDTVRWTFSADIVESKGLDVLVPSRTYADLPVEATNYQGLVDSRADYLSVLRGG